MPCDEAERLRLLAKTIREHAAALEKALRHSDTAAATGEAHRLLHHVAAVYDSLVSGN